MADLENNFKLFNPVAKNFLRFFGENQLSGKSP